LWGQSKRARWSSERQAVERLTPSSAAKGGGFPELSVAEVSASADVSNEAQARELVLFPWFAGSDAGVIVEPRWSQAVSSLVPLHPCPRLFERPRSSAYRRAIAPLGRNDRRARACCRDRFDLLGRPYRRPRQVYHYCTFTTLA
jgi:hypothetical protein